LICVPLATDAIRPSGAAFAVPRRRAHGSHRIRKRARGECRAQRRGPSAGAEGDDTLGALKRLLKVETERLRTRHRLGLGGREIAAGCSDLVYMVVRRACQLAAAEFTPLLAGDDPQLAVVALGGYGRRELAPCSDVDLLFLRADRADDDIRALVEHSLALLWDAGLTVGHSFRTVGECVAMARDDLHTRTAVCEARLLAGSATLFARLIDQTDTDVFASARATATFLESLRFDLAERYARHGSAVGHLEPQVKEGAGGLRDLHVVLWVAHARFGTRGLAALHEQGRITDRERKAALRAYDYLYRVRNEAHFTRPEVRPPHAGPPAAVACQPRLSGTARGAGLRRRSCGTTTSTRPTCTASPTASWSGTRPRRRAGASAWGCCAAGPAAASRSGTGSSTPAPRRARRRPAACWRRLRSPRTRAPS
jgi:hypothetical protein